MQNSGIATNRSVLPRWRPLQLTPQYEFISSKIYRSNEQCLIENAPKLLAQQSEWASSPYLAVEEVEQGLLKGRSTNSKIAAKFLLTDISGVTDEIRHMAKRHLNEKSMTNTIDDYLDIKEIFSCIRSLKERLKNHPRDGLSSLELARLYTNLNQNKNASKQIEIATKLYPENRYVLRSATRFYEHIGEPDRALSLLKSSDALKYDPWVQSAEVSICDILKKTPIWGTRSLKHLLQAPQAHLYNSELLAGLGSLEYASGSIKRARKLLDKALENPTENSLAQVRWGQTTGYLRHKANSQIGLLMHPYEADTYAAYVNKDAPQIVASAMKWLLDEPYSITPAHIGSSTALSILNDPKMALKFIDLGLRANAGDTALSNNKIVTLARQGKSKEARELIPLVEKYKSDKLKLPFFHAAHGVVNFSEGNIVKGRENYLMAVRTAMAQDDFKNVGNAMIYWCEQEVFSGAMSKNEAMSFIAVVDKFLTENAMSVTGLEMAWQAIRPRMISKLEGKVNYFIPDEAYEEEC